MSRPTRQELQRVHAPPNILLKELDAYRTWISASTAAVACLVTGFPFDSIKTRMQTHPYNSMLDCAQRTYRLEGVRGFYRGILPPLFTVSFLKSISFTVYESSKHSLAKGAPLSPSSIIVPSFISGAMSGAAVAIASGPLELVKIQKQLERLRGDPTAPDKGSLATARSIVSKCGARGLFYGFPMHLSRDVIGTGTYFAGYEFVKAHISRQSPGTPPGPLTHMLAGGMCGVMCWLVTFPLDLVKSVLQQAVSDPPASRRTVPQIVSHIWRTEGPRGFYRGMGVTLIRAFPIHSLNFVVYEEVSGWIKRHAHG